MTQNKTLQKTGLWAYYVCHEHSSGGRLLLAMCRDDAHGGAHGIGSGLLALARGDVRRSKQRIPGPPKYLT